MRTGTRTTVAHAGNTRKPCTWNVISLYPHGRYGGTSPQWEMTTWICLGSIILPTLVLGEPFPHLRDFDLGNTITPILGLSTPLMSAALSLQFLSPPPCTLVGTHSGGQGSVLQARCLLGSLLWALQWWGATAELSS